MGSFKRKMRRRREREAKERRVVLQRLPERDRFGSRTPIGTCTEAAVAMWRKRWEREVRPGWKTHPVARLTENGVDYGTKPRPGDEVAYGMDPNREDDCLQAALATATQVPIEEVPDLDLDKRLEQGDGPDELIRESWERIGRWATERGMTLEFFGPDSLPAPRRRWVGLVISSTAFRAEADAYGRPSPARRRKGLQ